MDKFYSKVNKPIHRAIAAAGSYLEAEQAGVRVLSSLLNLLLRTVNMARAQADPLIAERLLAPLMPFQNTTCRLYTRHVAECERQLRQVAAVIGLLHSCQTSLNACVDEVLDAYAKAGALRTSEPTPEFPLSPLQLRNLVVGLRSTVACDLLAKLGVRTELETADLIGEIRAIAVGRVATRPFQATVERLVRRWASGCAALGVDVGLLAPASGGAGDDGDAAGAETLQQLWRRTSHAIWKYTGTSLAEPLVRAASGDGSSGGGAALVVDSDDDGDAADEPESAAAVGSPRRVQADG